MLVEGCVADGQCLSDTVGCSSVFARVSLFVKAGRVRLNCRLSFQKLDQAKKSPSLSDPGSQCFAVNFKSLTMCITQIYRLLKPLDAVAVPEMVEWG